jgi:hypothetical protein
MQLFFVKQAMPHATLNIDRMMLNMARRSMTRTFFSVDQLYSNEQIACQLVTKIEQ